MNRLVFWLALGFLVYVLATSRFGGQDGGSLTSRFDSSKKQSEAITKQEPKTSLLESTVENVIRPVMEGKLPPELSKNIKALITEPKNINDVIPGQGNTAICGSKVVTRYSLDGVVNKSDITFIVGEHTVFPGLEWVVMGMKEKGARKADLPVALAYNNMALAKDIKTAGQTVPIRVELVSSSPEISYEPYMVQVFDKTFGAGEPSRCLDMISFHYSVRTIEGKLIADSQANNGKPLEIKIGQGTLPLGIEQALIGMQEYGERTVILFPEVMKRMGSENKLTLLNESSYPKAPLIFELKRVTK